MCALHGNKYCLKYIMQATSDISSKERKVFILGWRPDANNALTRDSIPLSLYSGHADFEVIQTYQYFLKNMIITETWSPSLITLVIDSVKQKYYFQEAEKRNVFGE